MTPSLVNPILQGFLGMEFLCIYIGGGMKYRDQILHAVKRFGHLSPTGVTNAVLSKEEELIREEIMTLVQSGVLKYDMDWKLVFNED